MCPHGDSPLPLPRMWNAYATIDNIGIDIDRELRMYFLGTNEYKVRFSTASSDEDQQASTSASDNEDEEDEV